jgi:hypothetical protein
LVQEWSEFFYELVALRQLVIVNRVVPAMSGLESDGLFVQFI